MAFSDGPDGRAKRIVILGSTGSIGRQTLDVCRMHPDKLQVMGLSCHSHIRLMEEQAQEFQVQASAVGVEEALSLLERDDVDVVVNAAELSEAQRAQIEDIIVRKTGVTPDAIVISTLSDE